MEIMEAFMAVAPEIAADPENGPANALAARGINPEKAAGIGNTLVQMFTRGQTPPEDAVPAAFTIGFLIGLEIGRSNDPR